MKFFASYFFHFLGYAIAFHILLKGGHHSFECFGDSFIKVICYGTKFWQILSSRRSWRRYKGGVGGEGESCAMYAIGECEKNMETIYWTCGGVANMVNIIIVRLN